jgi:hypothetical protein
VSKIFAKIDKKQFVTNITLNFFVKNDKKKLQGVQLQKICPVLEKVIW